MPGWSTYSGCVRTYIPGDTAGTLFRPLHQGQNLMVMDLLVTVLDQVFPFGSPEKLREDYYCKEGNGTRTLSMVYALEYFIVGEKLGVGKATWIPKSTLTGWTAPAMWAMIYVATFQLRCCS